MEYGRYVDEVVRQDNFQIIYICGFIQLGHQDGGHDVSGYVIA